jgi:ankyrin repeat protein
MKSISTSSARSIPDKVITATKMSNYDELESFLLSLEDDSSIDPNAIIDQHGNTLLLIAGQQGSRRICKLLLRYGSKINHQNYQGNSVLHYCFAYGFDELGKYLISKVSDKSSAEFPIGDGSWCY